jgi:PBP4 family serine-type D-alanyl-D-alanine carboxypeptidase
MRPFRRLGTGLIIAAGVAVSSPRAALAQSSAVDRLGADIERALSTYASRSTTWAVAVTSLDRGDTLFSMNADTALAPASNMKLLTAAAALETLGPDFRFQTFMVTQGTVRDGVLDGDLVLYGTGDPGISDRYFPDKYTVFDHLIDQLIEAGIHTVHGDLVGDASFLSGPLRPGGWDPRDLNDHFAPAVSALSFNENVVSFWVEPAAVGSAPIVHTIPDHAGLDVVNKATTVAGTPRLRLSILRDEPTDAIRIEGAIRRNGRDVWRQVTVPDPPAFTLSVLRQVMSDRGIEVDGVNRVETSADASALSRPSITVPSREDHPRTRTLARHTSPPLTTYLEEMVKRSNNLYAELIFRTVGRVELGSGSPSAAAAAVAVSLADLGVAPGGTIQTDGSGLSADNRISASSFVSLLTSVAKSDFWTPFWHALPVAGTRRELGRMRGTPAAGNLRAKTGTIEDVSALSGVVRSRDGERLAFSIIVNGAPSSARAKRVENEVGVRLASFSRGESEALAAHDVVPDPEQAAPSSERYRVRAGENFTTIARRHRVSLDAILRMNPSIEPRRLRAGQWILIPQATHVAQGS